MAEGVLLLLVEDESLVAMTLEDALEAGGYAVVVAASGTEAIAILDERCGEICGLVTDIQLGDGPNGWDVARHSRELNSGLPIVYTTANSADAWPVEGVPKSVLIPKPYAPAQVVTAISELVSKAEVNRTISSGDR